MTIEEDTSPEDTSPRGGPSLLYMVLAAISILAIFALIVWYFKGRKAPESKEEEWIWIKEETTTGGQTNKVIKERQRKDIQKKPGVKVTELVETVIATTTGVYINYLQEEEIVELTKTIGTNGVESVIKASEEKESARKDTIEIEIRDEKTIRKGKLLCIKRIKRKDLDAERDRRNTQGETVTVRETKEERRNRIKKLKEEGAGKK